MALSRETKSYTRFVAGDDFMQAESIDLADFASMDSARIKSLLLRAIKKLDGTNKAEKGKHAFTFVSDVRKRLIDQKVEKRATARLKRSLTEREIVERVGGGDKTSGSCSSVAFAYIGNKEGIDVLDFRGGKSREFFARSGNISEIANLPGIISFTEKHTNDFAAVKKLLGNLEKDKEYYLATGRHAAIIRIDGKGYQYLELQSAVENGFKPLNTTTLKNRFKCQKSHTSQGMKLQATSVIIDADSLGSSTEFRELLGYLNTAANSQRKGVEGYAK